MGMPKGKNKRTSKEIFQFSDSNGTVGKCELELHVTEDHDICIVTEVADNAGMSVTNAVEFLAAQVCKRHSLDITRVVWIEHYGPDSYPDTKDKDGHRYDLVTFKLTSHRTLTKPEWYPMSADDWYEIGLKPRK